MNLMMQYQTGPSYADNAEGMACARAAARLACAVDGCPAGVWVRDGWLAVSTVAPDIDDDDARDADGWMLTVVEHDGWSELPESMGA